MKKEDSGNTLGTREKKLEATRGERKLPTARPFPLTEIKRWKDRSEEECVPEGEEAQKRKEEREEDRRAGHLREMDLGAPRGHILFPFEAPDKSNAAECIIR